MIETDILQKAGASTKAPVDELFDQLLERVLRRWRGLPDKPEETPYGTVCALWFTAASLPRSMELATESDLPELDRQSRNRLDELIDRRMAGVPLAYLTGRQRFMGMEFETNSSALIPRKETEILGRTVGEVIQHEAPKRPGFKLMDLCTGSGNLAVALTHRHPNCQTFAADLCPRAVELARRNARSFGLEDRIDFRVGDLFEPFQEESLANGIDLIVCNPPYISSAKVAAMPLEISAFEPSMAFDAGAFGLKVLSRLIKESPRYLRPASWLCFEVGIGQGKFLATSMERMREYEIVRTVTDGKGEVRVLAARTAH